MPAEFNEFLPKDCEEYKRWKAATQSGAPEGQLEQLSLKDGGAAPQPEPEEKLLPGGKKKKKQKPEVRRQGGRCKRGPAGLAGERAGPRGVAARAAQQRMAGSPCEPWDCH